MDSNQGCLWKNSGHHEGRQDGGKAGGLDTDHSPALSASFDPYTYWEGGMDWESSQQGGH